MVRQSPGHKVGSMLTPLARSCNLPVDWSTSSARPYLHVSRNEASMKLLSGPLFVKATLSLIGVHFAAGQRQSFKHPLVSKLRLGIRLLGWTSGGVFSLCRSLVLLSHRQSKLAVAHFLQLAPGAWQANAVYNRPKYIANPRCLVRCRTLCK